MMSWLGRVMATGQELVCVTALATVLTVDADENGPDKDRVIDAVRDFRKSSYEGESGQWEIRTMYSDRVLAWLAAKVIEAAREQGALNRQMEGGTLRG
jgi:hypothetical protein